MTGLLRKTPKSALVRNQRIDVMEFSLSSRGGNLATMNRIEAKLDREDWRIASHLAFRRARTYRAVPLRYEWQIRAKTSMLIYTSKVINPHHIRMDRYDLPISTLTHSVSSECICSRASLRLCSL